MKKTLKKILAGLLFAVLISTVSMAGAACKKKEATAAGELAELSDSIIWENVGEGKLSFHFTVVDDHSVTSYYNVRTDESTVGAALLKLDMIAGEDGDYGLYVKEVNGITADYDKDRAYWGFFVNDDYASSGVDTTEIKEGEVYSLRYTKG